VTAALDTIGQRVRARHRLLLSHLDALGIAYGRDLVDENVAIAQLLIVENELRFLGELAELLVGFFEEVEIERGLAELDRRLGPSGGGL
jgi:hypothetical protein